MPAVIDLLLPSAGDTEVLGAVLAHSLPRAAASGVVLYLQGDLGAGKTTCVRSLLRTLGITRPVRSPTYTLVETYAAVGLTCIHVDLYRLRGELEAQDLALRDMAGPGCLFLIEWPEKGGAALPRADLDMRLEYRGEGRSVRLTALTLAGEGWLKKLGHDASLRPYVSNIT